MKEENAAQEMKAEDSEGQQKGKNVPKHLQTLMFDNFPELSYHVLCNLNDRIWEDFKGIP